MQGVTLPRELLRQIGSWLGVKSLSLNTYLRFSIVQNLSVWFRLFTGDVVGNTVSYMVQLLLSNCYSGPLLSFILSQSCSCSGDTVFKFKSVRYKGVKVDTWAGCWQIVSIVDVLSHSTGAYLWGNISLPRFAEGDVHDMVDSDTTLYKTRLCTIQQGNRIDSWTQYDSSSSPFWTSVFRA